MKKFLQKFMPSRQEINQHKILRVVFGSLIYSPNLWHCNRNSVARACSVGLFCAWIPVPFQMLLAAGASLVFRANLPLSVALVWTTNPLTMPPLFYFAYKLGAYILQIPPQNFKFHLNIDFLHASLSALPNIWKPFLFGCLICGIISSIIGNIAIRYIWRYHIIKALQRKNKERQKNKQDQPYSQ